MPFVARVETSFEAAHTVPRHPGKCKRLHGHNYRVEVFVASERVNEVGYVMDFADIKSALKEITGPFDHRFLDELQPFVDSQSWPSTAEKMAQYIYQQLQDRLEQGDAGPSVQKVIVWETPRSAGIYYE